MEKTIIHTDAAPKAIGPYSQAVVVGGVVYTSGQIALDPATGAMITGGTAREVEQVIQNLTHVLAEAGSSWAQVVKATIYVLDLGDFAIVNEAYGRVLEGTRLPARSTVQVAALPKGARVEIDLVALVRPQV